MKRFPDKQKFKEFITIKLALEETLFACICQCQMEEKKNVLIYTYMFVDCVSVYKVLISGKENEKRNTICCKIEYNGILFSKYF